MIQDKATFVYLALALVVIFLGPFIAERQFTFDLGFSKAVDWNFWYRITSPIPTASNTISPTPTVSRTVSPSPTTVNGVITVLSPKGGETFYQASGRSIYMKWQVSSSPSDWPNPLSVNADLYEYFSSTNTYVLVRQLEPNIAKFDCAGYYVAMYPVPTNVPTGIGHTYVIRISSSTIPGKYYAYSGKFTIVSQGPSIGSVTVNSPNSNDNIWVKGTTQTIKWTASGASQVHIWWAKGGAVPIPSGSGICYSSNISGGVIPNTGSFIWNIPGNLITGSDYKIWVFGINALSGTSNLSIVSKINITSPQGGETWSEGETHNIIWFPLTGVPSNTVMNISLHRASDPTFSRVVAQNINNFESQYSWSIPYDLGGFVGKPPRSDFYISIEAKSGTQVVGKGTSNQFTIYDAPIPLE